jgi:hypothetical protein
MSASQAQPHHPRLRNSATTACNRRRRRLWGNIQTAARVITDNPWVNAALTACGFMPGLAAAICGGVQAAAYAVQGRGAEALASVAGMALGAAVGAGLKLAVKAYTIATIRAAPAVARAATAASARTLGRSTYWSGHAIGNLVGMLATNITTVTGSSGLPAAMAKPRGGRIAC